MSISQLPEETFCEIVSFTIPDKNMFLRFEDESSLTRISPNNISCVCRRWREITLSNPSLWSTIFMCPPILTKDELQDTTLHLHRCLKRSKNTPLSCDIKFYSIFHIEYSLVDFAHQLFRSLFEHQSRWKAIKIQFPSADGRTNQWSGSMDLVFNSNELRMLETIHLKLTATFKFRISGPAHLSSLTSLTLEFEHYPSDFLNDWLIRSPNLEELVVFSCNRGPTGTVAPNQAITLERLRTLHLDVPLSGLQQLHCPLLENFTADTTYSQTETRRIYDFLSHSPPSRTLHGKYAFPKPAYGAMLQDYLDHLPKLETLSLSFLRGSTSDGVQRPNCALFTMLLGRTPDFEHLEVFDVDSTLESALDFMIARWTHTDRRLKSVKLNNCFDSVRQRPFAEIVADPEALPDTWEQVKTFINEGLVLEFS